VNYVLDTNACIALINDKPAWARAHFNKALRDGSHFFVSSVTAFELWYGVAKSTRPEFNRQRVAMFFSGPVQLLPFEAEDAEIGGGIRAELEVRGKPVGPYDILIAAQAINRSLTLVTADTSEFGRLKNLSLANWAKP